MSALRCDTYQAPGKSLGLFYLLPEVATDQQVITAASCREGKVMAKTRTVYIVAVYLCDRAYGGPEEGGWWYDTGEMVRIIRAFKDEERAAAHATRMNGLLNATINKGRREISSVLSDGRYYAVARRSA